MNLGKIGQPFLVDLSVPTNRRCDEGCPILPSFRLGAVLTNQPATIQVFALYAQRFQIEPHFKDYKSAGFEIEDSRLRHPGALARLFMLLATAELYALQLGVELEQQGKRRQIDWHSRRGLSLVQLGLRWLQQLCHQGQHIPKRWRLPRWNPEPATASKAHEQTRLTQIEFNRVRFVS